MQFSDPITTWSRAPYYWARIYTDQLRRGGQHRNLKPAIVIVLANYIQFKYLVDQSHHIFELRHRFERNLVHPDMRIDFVELPKVPLTFPWELSLPPSERLSIWGQFFRGPADKSLEEAYMSDPVLKATRDKLITISRDEKKRERARQAERAWLMRADAERLTRETLDETREQGREEGRAEAEAKTKMDTLKRVLADEATAALSDEAIARIAGVGIDVVSAARRAPG